MNVKRGAGLSVDILYKEICDCVSYSGSIFADLDVRVGFVMRIELGVS